MMKKIIACIGLLFILIQLTGAYPSVYPLGVTIYNKTLAYNGYTTFSVKYPNEKSNTMYMIDMYGNVVHKWENLGNTLQIVLLKNGHILTPLLNPRPKAKVQGDEYAIVERDWDNRVVWNYTNEHLHHPFKVLPNGDIMAIFWTKLPDYLHDKVIGGLPGTEAENNTIYTDYVRIFDRNGTVKWEWRAWEDLNISKYPLNNNGNRNHWPNVNVVYYLPQGNPFNGRESVLISLRRPSTLIVVDKATKEVVWEWGNGEISYQHDPQVLDNGNILVFDNGLHRPDKSSLEQKSYSRVVEVNPRIGKVVWEYKTKTPGLLPGIDFESPIGGFVQRLPNGNTLITETCTGRIFEVTREGKIVWEFNTGRMVDGVYRFTQEEMNFPERLPEYHGKVGKGIFPEWSVEPYREPKLNSCVGWLVALSVVLIGLLIYIFFTRNQQKSF
ncbi:hypothetical protein DRJ48_05265 [Candidatus Woesearchaeota archaeon]|nr:MAG: hypothetical protein DRJ48_05265 [Candidatus Woesearchaeota archaeon]